LGTQNLDVLTRQLAEEYGEKVTAEDLRALAIQELGREFQAGRIRTGMGERIGAPSGGGVGRRLEGLGGGAAPFGRNILGIPGFEVEGDTRTGTVPLVAALEELTRKLGPAFDQLLLERQHGPVIINQQNGRYTYPDAGARERNTVNGRSQNEGNR
jgi:hypothetical protein